MLIRKIARPLLASVFVVDGISTLRNPESDIAAAEGLTKTLSAPAKAVNSAVPAPISVVPTSSASWVKAVSAVKIIGGLALGLGKVPRLAAGSLAAAQLHTVFTRDAFWSSNGVASPTGAVKTHRSSAFITDLALLGGLAIAASDTAGKPGLAWRAQKASAELQSKLPNAKEQESFADSAKEWGSDLATKMSSLSAAASEKAEEALEAAKEAAIHTAEKSSDAFQQAKENLSS